MAGRSSKKSASSRTPEAKGTHDEQIASTIARIATLLLEHRTDVAAKMALVKETFGERAAIREYLGGQHRVIAETQAIGDTCSMLGIRYVRT